MPSDLRSVTTENGLEVSWDSVDYESCFFSFSVSVRTASGEVIRPGMVTSSKSMLLSNLQPNEQYNVSVTSVAGFTCSSDSATRIFILGKYKSLP